MKNSGWYELTSSRGSKPNLNFVKLEIDISIRIKEERTVREEEMLRPK